MPWAQRTFWSSPDRTPCLSLQGGKKKGPEFGRGLTCMVTRLEWEWVLLLTSEKYSDHIPLKACSGLCSQRCSPRVPVTLPGPRKDGHQPGPLQGSFHQGPALMPTLLPSPPLPQLHNHTLLTDVIKLPCHFHLIMVMTRGRGQPSQEKIQSKLISRAGDGNGTPLLATPRNHTPWEQQGAPGSGSSAPLSFAGRGSQQRH